MCSWPPYTSLLTKKCSLRRKFCFSPCGELGRVERDNYLEVLATAAYDTLDRLNSRHSLDLGLERVEHDLCGG